MDFSQLFLSFVNILTLLLAIVLGITVHEAAHAWVANKLGDPTAKLEGRISLNPLAHLDPIGTISLLVMHMGWGKSVPYNPNNFKHPVRDAILTALAGPAANLLLAMILIIPLKHLVSPDHIIAVILAGIIEINIVLMVFNLLPIPPLDGSKLLLIIFSKDKFKDLQQYAYIPSLVFIGLIGVEAIFGIPLLSRVLGPIVSLIYISLFQIS
ncbi:MAG: site-2 protease family protein [Candidatus Gracilibacteria bacterium]